jgi:hypothetical protein
MKYLNRREDFLNKSKYTKIENLIKEEAGTRSGPFENDIPWGDSLLGRLIMATIRKASIGINIMSIKRLIPRLTDQFNEILESCKINEDSRKDVARVVIFALLKELKDAVDAGKEVDILVSITDDTISNVEKAEIEEDKKTKLLQELEEWRKFLLEFKDGSTPEVENSTESNVTVGSMYPLMIKNLKALTLILSNYKKVQLGVTLNTGNTSVKEPIIGGEYLYNNKVVKVISLNNSQKSGIDKKWLTPDDEKGESIKPLAFIIWRDPVTKTYKPDVIGQSVDKTKLKPLPSNMVTKESNIFGYTDFVKYLTEAQYKNPTTPEVRTNPLGNKPGANIDRNNVVGTEDHLTQAYSKLKKDIEVLISPKEKGIGVDSVFINDIIAKSVDSKNKEIIKDLYKEINRYLIGDKKTTIQEKEPLFKESIEILTDKRKLTIVAEKIARFIKRALQFDGQNLYGGLGDLKVPLQDFVTTTKQLSKPVSTKEVTDDDKSLETSKPDDSRIQKIKDYFYEKIDYAAFAIEKTEIDKIEGNLENVQNDKLVLSIDPIIEILKLFNRAYKLHTTNVIPGGRSEGKVSRSVYNEYTPLGGGNASGNSGTSDGPYRNNKTFNVWEDAVLDIMKQRKYQPIFSKDTEILIGGKLVKGAGSTFKKLVTDLLDGDKLYKDGAQKRFLNEYFGPDAVPPTAKLSIGDDEKVNATNAADIKTTELSFIKNSDLTTNEDIKNSKFTNKILQVKGKEGTEDRTIYIFVEGMAGGYVNISYCTSIYFFKKYIDAQGSATIKALNTLVSSPKSDAGNYLLRYSKIKLEDFKKLLIGGKVELNSVTTGKTTQTKVIQPTLVSWLGNDTDKSLYSIGDVDRLSGTKTSVGGSRNVSELVNKKYGENNDFEPISKVV